MPLLPIAAEANISPGWAEVSAGAKQLDAAKALIIFSGSPMAVPVIKTTCSLGLGQVTDRCHETSRSCSLPRRMNSLPASKNSLPLRKISLPRKRRESTASSWKCRAN
jgi:hypothetical protein